LGYYMMQWPRILSIYFCTLCISCSENQQDEVSSSVPLDTLHIEDSIGVMYGDSNYVFGSISDIARDQRDELYVLDRKRNCILVYSPMGEYIQQIGRYGEGPGEFNDPSQLVITGDGSIYVVNHHQWCHFSSDLVFLESQQLDNQGIMHMESFGHDSIVGIVNILSLSDEGMSVDRRIAMWDVYYPNHYHTIFYQEEHTANVPNDVFTIDLYYYVKFTVIDDIIYVASEPISEPLIYSYDRDGSPRDTLFLPYSVVPKTELDIAEEKAFVEDRLFSATSGERSIEWEPYPNRPMIGELGTDSLGRLWVQRGFEDVPTFDIIDPYSLEIIETAVIPEIDDQLNWEFQISKHGMLGFSEYDYPIVYIIR
jgi:hypothetical protein